MFKTLTWQHFLLTTLILSATAKLPASASQADENCFQAIEQGKQSLAHNDLQHALDFFQSAQTFQPSDARPYFWIGICYEKSNNPSAAVKAYANCVQAAKLHGMDSAELRIDLGNALCRLNYFKEAVYDYQRAITIDPTMTVAHLGLARAYVDLKDWSNALKEINYCGTHSYSPPELGYLKALALFGSGDRVNALQTLRTFITEQKTLQNSQIMQKALALEAEWQR